jgi:ATP-binding cassette, subfamily B, bacterial
VAFGGGSGAVRGGPRGAGTLPQAGPDAAEARQAGRDRQLLRRVGALFRPYRRRLVLIVLSIVVASGLGVVTPFLTQRTFDDALFVEGGPKLRLLTVLVALQIVIPLVAALIGVLQTYLTTVVGNRVMADLRNRLFEHLEAMDLGFFTSTKTGSSSRGCRTTSAASRAC